MRRLRLLVLGDEGSVAVLVPFLALGILLLGGLVIDGSALLNARGRAVAIAEEAARAGASAVDLTAAELRLLDDPDVRARVDDGYCSDAAELAKPAVVTCRWVETERVGGRPLIVHTEVTLEVEAGLLGMIGADMLTATGTGQAQPYDGRDEEED